LVVIFVTNILHYSNLTLRKSQICRGFKLVGKEKIFNIQPMEDGEITVGGRERDRERLFVSDSHSYNKEI